MRRHSPFRDRPALSLSSAAAWLAALALIGLVPEGPALGQVPGPETFAPPPTTPLGFWEAADYLVRTGQAKQAVPYLDSFLKANPDDATLVQVRDRYGVGSILRLDDDPATRPYAKPIADRLALATRRLATDPGRIERFVAGLTRSHDEQEYAVERLREAGSYAVPALVRALGQSGLSADDRAQLIRNMGRLDASAVPALLAALDGPDARLAANVADALGGIGDPRAVPLLTFLAAKSGPLSPAGQAARRAIDRLTGRPFEAQPRSPVNVLLDEARKYHVHAVRFPGDSVLIWTWDAAQGVPAPRQVSKADAEATFGTRLAREALELDPSSRPAQALLVAMTLDRAVNQVGLAAFPAKDPSGAFPAAVAAGPEVLGDVLRQAIADGKPDLAAAAATALGQVTDPNTLAGGRTHPLVEALSAPGRSTQFAAARALVALNPRGAFPGSSRVVPTLARFVINQAPPRAVVIDGNVTRGSRLAGFLKELGYEPEVAATGDAGFRAAAETADVELIFIDPHFVTGHWRLADTLGNLRADARTAAIPTYIVAPQGIGVQLADAFARFPGVKFLVTPTDAGLLQLQLGGRPSGLSDAERGAYAREAAALLAAVSQRGGGPFQADLSAAEPALATALNVPETGVPASIALGDIPDAEAQRGLADAVLDPSKPAPVRANAAAQLARSIRRFGPLVAAPQEARLAAAHDAATDPSLRTALATVLGALRPQAEAAGRRLLNTPTPAPEAATPATEPEPTPEAEPGAEPEPEAPPAEAAEAPAAEQP